VKERKASMGREEKRLRRRESRENGLRREFRRRPAKGDLTDRPDRLLFEVEARLPQRWLENARRLRVVADSIGPLFARDMIEAEKRPADQRIVDDLKYSDVGPVYLMLVGLAIESLVKGILVHRDPRSVVEGKLSCQLLHHDLPVLFGAAQIRLDPAEKRFVTRLKEAIMWYGRYPVPTKAQRRKRKPEVFVSASDPDLFDALYERIEVDLRKIAAASPTVQVDVSMGLRSETRLTPRASRGRSREREQSKAPSEEEN
jgi:hypothetical protein